MNNIEYRVAGGVAFLDERKPGWYNYILPWNLDMEQACKCVLGHNFGDFWRALTQLDISFSDAEGLGFVASEDENWDTLEQAWLKVIKSRIENDPNGVVKCACGLPMRRSKWKDHWPGCRVATPVSITDRDVQDLEMHEKRLQEQAAAYNR
jgi:hypothetical protein